MQAYQVIECRKCDRYIMKFGRLYLDLLPRKDGSIVIYRGDTIYLLPEQRPQYETLWGLHHTTCSKLKPQDKENAEWVPRPRSSTLTPIPTTHPSTGWARFVGWLRRQRHTDNLHWH